MCVTDTHLAYTFRIRYRSSCVSLSLSPFVVGLLTAIVLVAGTVNGLAGFGFAVVGTMVLATVVEPATAVAFMIVPLLGVNLALVRELSPTELRRCSQQFAPFILSALVGTLVGMVALDVVPDAPLRVGLGLVTLAFVVNLQQAVSIPGLEAAREGCFVQTPRAMVGVGAVSGVLFGGTNVGVQLVAYVRSCDLSHTLFVGVVALVFVAINALRVGAAGLLGLYPDYTLFAVSVVAVIPAVAGVAIGKRLRERASERSRRIAVLSLLSIIGIRLLLGGFGLV